MTHSTHTTRHGYAVVIVDHQAYEGWTTLDANGAVHIDQAKLRIRDSSRPDGVRRQPILPRTFSRTHRFEVRWMREPETTSTDPEVAA